MTFRKVSSKLAGLAGSAVILAGTAFGQASTAPAPAPRPNSQMAMTPQTSAADRMVAHLKSQLALSDAQTAQLKKIMDSRQEKMAAVRTAMMSAREALRKAETTSPVDEPAIRAAAQQLGQAEGDGALLQAQLHGQINGILTDEQKQKFAAMSGPARGPGGPPAMRPPNN